MNVADAISERRQSMEVVLQEVAAANAAKNICAALDALERATHECRMLATLAAAETLVSWVLRTLDEATEQQPSVANERYAKTLRH